MLITARKLLELIRFSHTLFALPFALLAAVMAWGEWHHDPLSKVDALNDTYISGGETTPEWVGEDIEFEIAVR